MATALLLAFAPRPAAGQQVLRPTTPDELVSANVGGAANTGCDVARATNNAATRLEAHVWDATDGTIGLGWRFQTAGGATPFFTQTIAPPAGGTLLDPDVVIDQVPIDTGLWRLLVVYVEKRATGSSAVMAHELLFDPAAPAALTAVSGFPQQLSATTGFGDAANPNVDAALFEDFTQTPPVYHSRAAITYQQTSLTTGWSSVYLHVVEDLNSPFTNLHSPTASRRTVAQAGSTQEYTQPDVAIFDKKNLACWISVTMVGQTLGSPPTSNVRVRQLEWPQIPRNNTLPPGAIVQVFNRPMTNPRAPRIAAPYPIIAGSLTPIQRDFCVAVEQEQPATTTQPTRWFIRAFTRQYLADPANAVSSDIVLYGSACENRRPAVAYVGDGIRVAWTHKGTGCLSYDSLPTAMNGSTEILSRYMQLDGSSTGNIDQVNDADAPTTAQQRAVSACGRGLAGTNVIFSWADLTAKHIRTKLTDYSSSPLRPQALAGPEVAVWPVPYAPGGAEPLHVRAAEPLVRVELLELRSGRVLHTWQPATPNATTLELPLDAPLPRAGSGATALRVLTARRCVTKPVVIQ